MGTWSHGVTNSSPVHRTPTSPHENQPSLPLLRTAVLPLPPGNPVSGGTVPADTHEEIGLLCQSGLSGLLNAYLETKGQIPHGNRQGNQATLSCHHIPPELCPQCEHTAPGVLGAHGLGHGEPLLNARSHCHPQLLHLHLEE